MIAIAPLPNYFSLLKVGLNVHFKYCFHVVTILTSTLFIGFSIDLLNIVLVLNLAFCLFNFVTFFFCFSLQICIMLLHLKNDSCLKMFFIWIPLFYEFFNCSTKLNPNKAGLFEGSFFWERVNLTLPPPPSYFKKNLSNINITLYNC